MSTPVASLTIRCAVASKRPVEAWKNNPDGTRTGMHWRVRLTCGAWVSVGVGSRARSVACPECSAKAQAELARQELHAHSSLVAMHAKRWPAYRVERERMLSWQSAHEAEQASGRPGVGVD